MRTTWNGSLSFGLVSIPVGLAPATKPAARASDVSFRMLHRECGTPIKQKRYCPVHERDLEPDEIVKGWEVAKNQFVFVEEEELEALAQHDDSRSIEITRFVDAAQVDPVFFDRTYFLVPAQAPAARRPYVLLLNAMTESGMAALGRFIQQGKEKFCLIRAKGDALALETLYLSADVFSQAEIGEAVEEIEVKDAELALARQVIASLEADFDPTDLQSEYRGNLRAMLEAKAAGQEITAPEPVAEEAPVVDLMEALRRSVEEAQREKPARAPARRLLRGRPPGSARPRASSCCGPSCALVRLRERVQRLELGLEERLVDLALVDRHAFLDAQPDHVLPLHTKLLRELVRRQVVRHAWSSLRGNEKARWRKDALRRARLPLARCVVRDSTGPHPQDLHTRRILPRHDGRNERRRAAGAPRRAGRRAKAGTSPAAPARPLVLLHGLGGGALELDRAAARAGRALPRPRPRSSRPRPLRAAARRAAMAAYADVVAALIEREQAAPALVAGHSFGGLVALRLAQRRPELVRGLLLAAPAGIGSGTRVVRAAIVVERHRPAEPLGRPVPASVRRAALVPARALPPVVRLGRACRSRRAPTIGFLEGATEHVDVRTAGRALVRDDPRRELEQIRCPVVDRVGRPRPAVAARRCLRVHAPAASEAPRRRPTAATS